MLIEPGAPLSSPLGPRAVVDARPLLVGHARDALVDLGEHALGIPREPAAPVGHAQDLAERLAGPRRRREATVEEHVGDAGLLLYAVGERDERRTDGAEVDDDVRPRGQHATSTFAVFPLPVSRPTAGSSA